MGCLSMATAPTTAETYLGPTPQKRGQPLGQPPATAPQAALCPSLKKEGKRGVEWWGLCGALARKGRLPPLQLPHSPMLVSPLHQSWCVVRDAWSSAAAPASPPTASHQGPLPSYPCITAALPLGGCSAAGLSDPPSLELADAAGLWMATSHGRHRRHLGASATAHATCDVWATAPHPGPPVTPVLHWWLRPPLCTGHNSLGGHLSR